MAERDTSKLKDLQDEATVLQALVDIHYPDPTPLTQVVKEVAHWANLAFIMEPSANCKIQIFAPRKMPPDEAYEVFLASLSLVGLRAIRKGDIVKIVSAQVAVTA